MWEIDKREASEAGTAALNSDKKSDEKRETTGSETGA